VGLRRVAELPQQGFAKAGEELPDGERILLYEPQHIGELAAANPNDTPSVPVEKAKLGYRTAASVQERHTSKSASRTSVSCMSTIARLLNLGNHDSRW
jgi:hypothetical protein